MRYKIVNNSSREMPVEIFEIITMNYEYKEMLEKINKECDDYNLKVIEIDLNNEDDELTFVIGDWNTLKAAKSQLLNG